MKSYVSFARKPGRPSAVPWIAGILMVLGEAAAVRAQELHLAPFTEDRGLPSGFVLNRVSSYVGGFDLALPESGGPTLAGGSMETVFGGGFSADLGWYLPGRRTEAFADWSVSYDGNARYPELNGTSYRFSLGVQRKVAPGVTFSLIGAGESSTLADYVFGMSRSLTLTSRSTSLGQLIRSVVSNPAPAATVASPIGVTLFGARRRDASVGAKITIAQSPRFTWNIGTSVLRDFPAGNPNASLVGTVLYPGVTTGGVSAGFTYSLTPQTEIGLGADYARTFSSFDRIQIGSGSASISHTFARQWFVHVRAGIGALADLRSAVGSPVRREYSGDAGIGTKLRAHTFLVTVSRSIADSYGLGAANTAGGEVAWNWHRPNGNWTIQSGVIYERLAGRTIQRIQGWLYQATALRRITRQTNFSVQAVYANDAGHYSGGNFTGLERRGVRMTIAWTPGTARGL